MTAAPLTAAAHRAAALADPDPTSRVRAGWDLLIALGGGRDAMWHAAAAGEYSGAMGVFAQLNGLNRAELRTFVAGLVREELDKAAAAAAERKARR